MNSPRLRADDEAWMLHPSIQILGQGRVASLIVGTVLAHFGITAEQVTGEFGLSYEWIEDTARHGFSWAVQTW